VSEKHASCESRVMSRVVTSQSTTLAVKYDHHKTSRLKHTLAVCSCKERTSPGLDRSLRLIASTRHTNEPSVASSALIPAGKTASLWITPSNVARYNTVMKVEPTLLMLTFTRSRTMCVNLHKQCSVI